MALVYHGPDLSEGRWHLGFHDTFEGTQEKVALVFSQQGGMCGG